MDCPKCRAANLAAAKFCVKCGEDLRTGSSASDGPVPSQAVVPGRGSSPSASRTHARFPQRSPAAVLLLPFVTFGIYSIIWYFKTADEMNARGGSIPSAWLLFVPIVAYWWLWKYSEQVEVATRGDRSTVGAFLLCLFLGMIGQAVIQASLNRH